MIIVKLLYQRWGVTALNGEVRTVAVYDMNIKWSSDFRPELCELAATGLDGNKGGVSEPEVQNVVKRL